jgi:hypothetical protein
MASPADAKPDFSGGTFLSPYARILDLGVRRTLKQAIRGPKSKR